ncbi:ABC transporter permease [Glycomyces sp. TRM65418]|uniref:ABC transporter permease n=1 Tax=Glycomyces sp. TRM65418 TaxID=2867006 RepID=UPI001CE69E32|nr:ABC transporter permease [Glycomyces sp. TRM65418]MCC3762889.1 ABC transporter permease [Glycomyces sp. TRM65418]QZD56914.1 ABC transporter permease [Glycomyces sp. TRM65418]
MQRLRSAAAALFGGGTGTVFALLIVILAGIFAMNPGFFEGPSLMAFLKQAAPLVILAAGQYFVIVSGNFDLSVGALVGAQVVIAARLIDGEESRTVPVLLVMLAFGLTVGLVNGLITTVLKVQSFITTLGMLLVLYGAIRLWTGGAPTGALSEAFRKVGRHGIDDVPLVGQIPWALLVMLAVGAGAILLMRTRFGRIVMATGDNDLAAALSGARVATVRTAAFVLSGLSATIAGVLIGGFAGVSAQVGEGLEFTVITEVVLGGVALGGGRGTALAAMAGALAIEALFTLFNQMALPATLRPTVQGAIIIAAVAYAARQRTRPAAVTAPATVSPS